MNYFQKLQEKHGDIDADEDQRNRWYKKGFSALGREDHTQAEKSFEKLAVASPWLPGGFEGLAYVYYETGRLKESEWFMMKALSLAEGLHRKGKLDEKILKMMKGNLQAMREEKELFRWWENINNRR